MELKDSLRLVKELEPSDYKRVNFISGAGGFVDVYLVEGQAGKQYAERVAKSGCQDFLHDEIVFRIMAGRNKALQSHMPQFIEEKGNSVIVEYLDPKEYKPLVVAACEINEPERKKLAVEIIEYIHAVHMFGYYLSDIGLFSLDWLRDRNFPAILKSVRLDRFVADVQNGYVRRWVDMDANNMVPALIRNVERALEQIRTLPDLETQAYFLAIQGERDHPFNKLRDDLRSVFYPPRSLLPADKLKIKRNFHPWQKKQQQEAIRLAEDELNQKVALLKVAELREKTTECKNKLEQEGFGKGQLADIVKNGFPRGFLSKEKTEEIKIICALIVNCEELSDNEIIDLARNILTRQFSDISELACAVNEKADGLAKRMSELGIAIGKLDLSSAGEVHVWFQELRKCPEKSAVVTRPEKFRSSEGSTDEQIIIEEYLAAAAMACRVLAPREAEGDKIKFEKLVEIIQQEREKAKIEGRVQFLSRRIKNALIDEIDEV